MITDSEREQIRQEAKSILDNFASALEKVDVKEKRLKRETGGYRQEKEGGQSEKEFRKIMFENAPEKDEDCIIAEKKKW